MLQHEYCEDIEKIVHKYDNIYKYYEIILVFSN